jgi:hypothetical protein
MKNLFFGEFSTASQAQQPDLDTKAKCGAWHKIIAHEKFSKYFHDYNI